MISIAFPPCNEAWSIRELLRGASEGLRRAGEDRELFVEDNSEVLR
jgi:hypothetical protein